MNAVMPCSNSEALKQHEQAEAQKENEPIDPKTIWHELRAMQPKLWSDETQRVRTLTIEFIDLLLVDVAQNRDDPCELGRRVKLLFESHVEDVIDG